MLRFIVNNALTTVKSNALKLSALEWLREQSHQKGTKEGCASGDCGACTVILGEQIDDKVIYRTANACLVPMSSLANKQLLTIESLKHFDHQHPVQRAMVECHGSQCGFCTPGFIMSLYALYLNYEKYPGREAVIHALSGNLCRCTGYQPILEAAEKMYQLPKAIQPCALEIFAQLPEKTTTVDLEQTDFVPTSLDSLFSIWQKHPHARIFAGATDYFLEYTQQLKTASQSIYLGQIEALKSVKETESFIEIGAAASFSDCLPTLLKHYPEATELFYRLGSTAIRNQGTFGGSLGNASPIGDPAPFLIAIKAKLKLTSQQGSRIIGMEDFFLAYKKTCLQPQELIHSILIPYRQTQTFYAFYKISKRYEDDISTLCMGLVIEHDNEVISRARVTFGGMAAVPQHSHQVASALKEAPFTEASFIKASDLISTDFSPLDDARASKQYRLLAAKNLIMRAFYARSGQVVRIQHA